VDELAPGVSSSTCIRDQKLCTRLGQSSRTEPGRDELRRRRLSSIVSEAGVDLRRDARLGVPREHGGLREREPERDERVPEVVQADSLPASAFRPAASPAAWTARSTSRRS
jgi:hypothetical protein